MTHLFLICSDVVTIEKTGEFFRLIYDVKGRFTVHRITADEAKVSKLRFESSRFFRLIRSLIIDVTKMKSSQNIAHIKIQYDGHCLASQLSSQ